MFCYAYNIPLHPSPLGLSHRRGILLETKEGWGEAAPLSDFVDAFAFALRSVKEPFPKRYPKIQLNALVCSVEEAEEALEKGFQTIKYKVKGLSAAQAVKTVRSLQAFRVPLRIDANQSWGVEEAKRFLGSLDPTGIEYIEEPISDPTRLPELPPFPFALDETLLMPDADAIAALPQVRALVLKPTALGERLDRWIAFGKKRKQTLTFSSGFESAVGLVLIAQLQEIYAPTSPAGLDTFRAFKHNFFPFPIERGELLPEPIPPIDRSCLTKIAH